LVKLIYLSFEDHGEYVAAARLKDWSPREI
jgi:hypothetical protein